MVVIKILLKLPVAEVDMEICEIGSDDLDQNSNSSVCNL